MGNVSSLDFMAQFCFFVHETQPPRNGNLPTKYWNVNIHTLITLQANRVETREKGRGER